MFEDRLTIIPIIAVTASAMKGDKAKILAGGCDDFNETNNDLPDFVYLQQKIR